MPQIDRDALLLAVHLAKQVVEDRGRSQLHADDGLLEVCDRLAVELWNALKATGKLELNRSWTNEDIGFSVADLRRPRFEMEYTPPPNTFFGVRDNESERPSGYDCHDFVLITRLVASDLFGVESGV